MDARNDRICILLLLFWTESLSTGIVKYDNVGYKIGPPPQPEGSDIFQEMKGIRKEKDDFAKVP